MIIKKFQEMTQKQSDEHNNDRKFNKCKKGK